MPDADYMTPAEFAALPSAAHHAVWKAHAEKRIQAIPAAPKARSSTRRYHRGQVEALLADGWPCCPHCEFCTEDEPLHGEPCDEPGCQVAA